MEELYGKRELKFHGMDVYYDRKKDICTVPFEEFVLQVPTGEMLDDNLNLVDLLKWGLYAKNEVKKGESLPSAREKGKQRLLEEKTGEG